MFSIFIESESPQSQFVVDCCESVIEFLGRFFPRRFVAKNRPRVKEAKIPSFGKIYFDTVT